MSNYDSPKETHELTPVTGSIHADSLIPCQASAGERLGVVKPVDIVKQTTLDDIQDGLNSIRYTEAERDAAAIHYNDMDNPHEVNQTDVGLSAVDNTSDLDKPISTATQTALDNKSDISHNHDGVYEPANANIQAHIGNTSNPHAVDASDVGLGNVDNTSDLNKPISTATQNALDLKFSADSVDIADGVPGLTQFKINFMNELGTDKSFFTNANAASRLYTFQDRDGIIADNTDLAGKQNSLGFTPVQQGTGIGQTSNTVKIGWSAASKLKATVDNSDQGYIVTEDDLTPLLNSRMLGSAGPNGYQKFSSGVTIQWGTFAHPASNPGYTVNFPLSFSAVYSITFGSSANGVEYATSLLNTGFFFYGGNVAKTVWYIAIGFITPA